MNVYIRKNQEYSERTSKLKFHIFFWVSETRYNVSITNFHVLYTEYLFLRNEKSRIVSLKLDEQVSYIRSG